MTRLPDPHRTPAPAVGQPAVNPDALSFLNDVEDALAAASRPPKVIPTSFHDPTPVPPVGTAPPVPQPGRAAMSSKAVDDTVRMIGASVVITVTGGAATGVLWASGHADPEVIAWVCAAPLGLAVPILAFSSLIKRIKQTVEAAPAEHHHHYNGPVTTINDHRHVNTHTRGLVASTRNQLPGG